MTDVDVVGRVAGRIGDRRLGQALLHGEVMEQAFGVGTLHVLASTMSDDAIMTILDDLRSSAEC